MTQHEKIELIRMHIKFDHFFNFELLNFVPKHAQFINETFTTIVQYTMGNLMQFTELV